MIFIAHRGASKQRKENTIEAFHFASDNGADIIEMDVRYTSDGVFVIFHDDTLKRVDGTETKVSDITYKELSNRIEVSGWPEVITLDKLGKEYKRETPFLFHIKFFDIQDKFIKELDRLNNKFYLGTQSVEVASILSKKYGRDRILGFMPYKDCIDEFIRNGAGIIRLWESWLDDESIIRCHEKDVYVWIMVKNKEGIGETDILTLNNINESGADGVLLNDICLVSAWKAQNNQISNV